MKYDIQMKKVKSFIDLHAKALNNDSSNEIIKNEAYLLFYQSIKVSNPPIYEDPNPISQFFLRLKHGYHGDLKNILSIVELLENWWLEWHFSLIMQAKLNQLNPQKIDNSDALDLNEQSHFNHLFAHIPIPICNVSLKTGKVIRINQRFTDVLGYTLEDIPDIDTWFVVAYPDSHYRNYVISLWNEAIKVKSIENKNNDVNNYCIRCKCGEEKMMDVSGIVIGDEYMAVFSDATEHLQAKEILTTMAFLDSLTKIANRRRFDELLNQEFKKAVVSKTDLSLIMIDIDNFKLFNDRYGHVAGDKCIHDIAQQIAAEVSRTEDFVARYGGEEFAVLLPNTDLKGALFVAEQIQKAVENLAIAHLDSFTGVVSISMGIAMINEQIKTQTLLVDAADSALYYAKKQGRNCIALSKH
ncbi:sensor domain-containing diguanylate cyclase [Pseudoalteromonas sp. MMG010]|uniref:sensor domain-containing diguanylate cyclase n=1 Tax=Pseudoalteromonas sp. MMG010 TaxID=2822685 RepID=UPI001B3A0EF6|nr:sensor domain-containing diguanylate cyclase [Pseudoalteromonas sp. MMG010]MBQ4832478.1 sensor domain-containing diguanylate cyclase [Pseudoalteromonas sp. MMG010]